MLQAHDLHATAVQVARRLDVAIGIGLVDLEDDPARVGILGARVVDGDDKALLAAAHLVQAGVQIPCEGGDAALTRDVGADKGHHRAGAVAGKAS